MKIGARKAIEASVAPDLLPGEIVIETAGAQTGPNPYWVFLTIWVLVFGAKYRTITLTNQALLIHSSNGLRPFNAKQLLQRVPHDTPIGPLSGLWSKVDVHGEQMYIHRRFHKDLDAINAGVLNGGPAAQPLPPTA